MTISSLRQKLVIKKYLMELSAIAGRQVREGELGSAEEAAVIRAQCVNFNDQPLVDFELRFSCLSGDSFEAYLSRLQAANHSPIHVWTSDSIDCGVWTASSLAAIDWSFAFDALEDGVVVLLANDLQDRLLLDFFRSDDGEAMVRVEAQGANWASVRY